MNAIDPRAARVAADSPEPEPLLEPTDHAAFLLRDRGDILPVLRGLQTAVDRVTVHFNEGRD